MGRATQGVKLINIKGNDSIAAVTKVMKEDETVIDAELAEGEITDENSAVSDESSDNLRAPDAAENENE